MLDPLFMAGYGILLTAVWAFCRLSGRLHLWLFEHPRFGPTIRAWYQYRVIPVRS